MSIVQKPDEIQKRIAQLETVTEKPKTEMVDVMGGDARRTIKVLDKGFIALVDVMPRHVPKGQTIGSAIVQAARVSYGAGTRKVSQDRGLIRYLRRHRHTTPFEMVEFKFHAKMPLFVRSQWIRHRTANVNEYSARYSIMKPEFYRPDKVRLQSKSNKQGSEGVADPQTTKRFYEALDMSEGLYEHYEWLVDESRDNPVAREMARTILPQNIYTEWYWKCDLHNIMHFLSLRMDSHAQSEIRDYADAMYALIEPIAPIAMEAFRDYVLGSISLTRLEIEAIENGESIDTTNSRELIEWETKRALLNLDGREPDT